MRIRSRTLNQDMSGAWGRNWTRLNICGVPSSEFTTQVTGQTFTNFKIAQQISSMSDMLAPAASAAKKKAWRKLQGSLRRQERGFKLRQFMPNHPCTHTTTTIRYEPGAFASVHSRLTCASTYTSVWGDSYDNAAVMMRALSLTGNDPSATLLSASINGTASGFRKHDWFALTSQFNEAIDSFIPSSMLLGETMYEHAIFVDAFKYIINPSNAVKDFLKGVVSLGLKKKNLGTIARIIKGSSNAWLSYNFGVKPAVEDVVKALTAHEIVQQRLRYLSANGGSYVPIRVRASYDSPFSNSSVPSSYPMTGNTVLRKWYISKNSTATIGAWGKVRDDLNWRDVWTAYLQHFGVNKVIGLAWELIPFSFVLDWFTNAQERINDLTRFRLGDPYSEVRNLSCSLTEKTVLGAYMLPGVNSQLSATMVKPTSHVLLATITDKAYSRYLTLPETSGVVDFSSLGLFQAIASGAMLVQRFSR